MNSRLRLGPPKQRLAQRSGSAMKPIGLPAASEIWPPSGCGFPMPQPHQRIAVDIAREAVRSAARLGGDEGAAVAEFVVVDVEHFDHAGGRARLDDVEFLLVGRKGKPV